MPPMRHVAIGDPQASFETFVRILDGHGLLDDEGALASDVHLVSMGDHFDYGKPELRAQATKAGSKLKSNSEVPTSAVPVVPSSTVLRKMTVVSWMRMESWRLHRC